jgi:hypothetical protein
MTPVDTAPSRRLPLWINALNVVLIAILTFKTYSAFLAPTLAYGDVDSAQPGVTRVLWELAGRNLAMILLSLVALVRQRPGVMACVFVLGLARESFDAFMALHFGAPGAAGLLQAASFTPFLVAYVVALRSLVSGARGPRPTST